MDAIAHEYIALAHDIERHDPGYIDGYFGGEQWKGKGTRTLHDMAGDVAALMAEVQRLDDGERRTFLTAQVNAMQTKIRLLQGEQIGYADEVQGLYDVEMVRTPESVFEQTIATLEDLLPGTGAINEREQALRRQFIVPPDRLTILLDAIIAEMRTRTLKLVDLPAGEGFETRLVRNEPWSAYNWYLGSGQSRVDMNTDLPTYLVGLPDTLAHEAYPGHHTEHLLKDILLWEQQGRGEHSILLINAPECVISEGIATRARRIVMSDDELTTWLESELAPLAGLTNLPIRETETIFRARRGLQNVTNNAAILYHADGMSEDEVVAYIQRYRLATEAEARKSLSFLKHPNFRSYGFTYTAGAKLLDTLFARKGNAEMWFTRLLREPVTPSVVRQWSAA